MSPRYWIGIDGGGTKTQGVLLDEHQQLLAEVRGESTNFNSVGQAQARLHLHQVISDLLEQTGLNATQVAGIGLGISGVSQQADAHMFAAWCCDVLPETPCLVENDALMALAAATSGELFGVVVVSGTGMIVLGVNRAGQRQRAGGWGALLDAHGSGFAIGKAALQAIAEAEDSVAMPTLLTGAVLAHLQLSTPRALESWAYTDSHWARFAAIAPLVSQCAAQGDSISDSILDASTIALSRSIRVVAERLGMSDAPFPCVFTGGNLAPDALLTERLAQRLELELPSAQIDLRRRNPAIGAAQWVQHRRRSSTPQRSNA